MNVATQKALFLDALHQVLDNRVFRILAALVLVPVLATLVLGFREQGISLLFGWKTWSYASVAQVFGGSSADVAHAREDWIAAILRIVFQYYAGTIGVIFCIAATAFFVPRLIEKGAADVVFHKPVSRFTLYLSRFLAGLLFVGLLSSALAAGMYLGLRLVSGYDDPGILWAAPQLVYVFGLIYVVSMWAGVTTRSSVAAILIAVVFFFCNGCVHRVWILREVQRDLTGAHTPDADIEEDEPPAILRMLGKTLVVAHYVLPKTTDADVMAEKLRRASQRYVYEDPETGLRLDRLPEGYRSVDRDRMQPAPPALRAALGEPLYQARTEDGTGRIELWRRARAVEETPRPDGSTRRRSERASQAAEELGKALAGPDGEPPTTSVLGADDAGGDALHGGILVTVETDQGLVRALVRTSEDEVTTILHVSPSPDAEQELGRVLASFSQVEADSTDPLMELYAQRMTLDAPWRTNPLFSIGSSLAFVAVLLLLGWFRLGRIDF